MGVFMLSITENLADGMVRMLSTVRCFRQDLLPKAIYLVDILGDDKGDIGMTLVARYEV